MGSRNPVVTSATTRRSSMARHCSFGRVNSGPVGFTYEGRSAWSAPGRATAVRLTLLLCLLGLLAYPIALLAQSSVESEVHVAPHPKPPANAAVPNGAPDIDPDRKSVV